MDADEATRAQWKSARADYAAWLGQLTEGKVDKRSIANALAVEFNDGRKLGEFVCEYPIGHKRRRKEGMPLLVEKFKTNLARRFPAKQQKAILDLCNDQKRLESTPVSEFVDLFVI